MQISVTASQAGFTSVTKTSPATTAVVVGTFDTAPNPTISSSPPLAVGKILGAVTTGWVPSDGVTFTYVWKRSDSIGSEGTPIANATGVNYTLVTADRGKYITLTVTASKPAYTSLTRTSAPTSVVG